MYKIEKNLSHFFRCKFVTPKRNQTIFILLIIILFCNNNNNVDILFFYTFVCYTVVSVNFDFKFKNTDCTILGYTIT